MNGLGPALRTVLLAGAARAGCAGDPAGSADLRGLVESGRLRELVEAGDWDGAERLIRSVMPAGWEPAPEWAAAIARLGA